ncbi:hypothetical protein CHU98_g872 [Xylaria longipes]|nr:hypothetical protein CHU98_g872 [Xylaria longipes]
MRSIDPKAQIAMLAQFKELRPLFERFGGSTLADALSGQLSESYTRNNPLMPLHKPDDSEQDLAPGKVIAWSREISDLGWEHGYFNLDLDVALVITLSFVCGIRKASTLAIRFYIGRIRLIGAPVPQIQRESL